MKLIEYTSFQNPIRLIVIGGVCSGKSTLANHFKQIGFKHISIDRFRMMYSKGDVVGENLAYNEFIKFANTYGGNCVIECTGLSYRYNEIDKQGSHFIYLECDSLTAKYRQVERDLKGYPAIPFPYSLQSSFDLSSVEFEDKIGYPIDLMNQYDTTELTSLEIFSDLLKRLNYFDSKVKEPKTQKQLETYYKYREYEQCK